MSLIFVNELVLPDVRDRVLVFSNVPDEVWDVRGVCVRRASRASREIRAIREIRASDDRGELSSVFFSYLLKLLQL